MEIKGLSFKTRKHDQQLVLVLEPLLIEKALDAKTLFQVIQNSQFANFLILENEIMDVCELLTSSLTSNTMDPIEHIVGEAKDAEVEVIITADKMIAELIVTAPYRGHTPDLNEMLAILQTHNIQRGISKKRIRELILRVLDSKPGIVCSQIIAKGLPPRDGKDSYLKPVVPNALERILAPKGENDEKLDMRDFGELICVKAKQIVARRIAPSLGRSGFTVTNEAISSTPGSWRKILMGDNVFIHESHKNTVMAKVAGLPKFANQKISIDDVYVSRGCNVATGNIKFAGAVIINGDVTEKMRILCDGDVTINGFVESAYIESGGDIIITQGATGKMNESDCQLIAKGSVFLEHGQGLDIDTGKNVLVAKQLAYSNVTCRGNVIIGRAENPMGKIFASNIVCYKNLNAGHVGAVSGSEIVIDFTEGHNLLTEKLNEMVKLFKDLSTKNADHEIKVSGINNGKVSAANKAKLVELNQELELERVFLNWLRINLDDIREQVQMYEKDIRISANHTIYPGVNVKFGKSNWKADKEYLSGQLLREDGKWVYGFRK